MTFDSWKTFAPLLTCLCDWAYDQHAAKGRSLGRGIDFFRKESTKLIPTPKPDPYEEEAYRLWKPKRGEE